jgi:hypothetical protein
MIESRCAVLLYPGLEVPNGNGIHSHPETIHLKVCFSANHLPHFSFPIPTLHSGESQLLRTFAKTEFPQGSSSEMGVGMLVQLVEQPYRDVISPPFSCLCLKNWVTSYDTFIIVAQHLSRVIYQLVL